MSLPPHEAGCTCTVCEDCGIDHHAMHLRAPKIAAEVLRREHPDYLVLEDHEGNAMYAVPRLRMVLGCDYVLVDEKPGIVPEVAPQGTWITKDT